MADTYRNLNAQGETMKRMALIAAVSGIVVAGGAGIALSDVDEVIATFPKDVVAKKSEGESYSGYLFSKTATRAMQDDDFENPGFLWLERGEESWTKAEGKAGKACASCHQKAEVSMKGVGATYPKYDKKLSRVINLEQRINQCRKTNMQAKPWKYESDDLLGMTAYVKLQSRGMPVKVAIDGPARKSYEAGRKFYNQRRGLLDLACANCHVQNAGNMVRADLLSQGQSNGFPTYRLKWQKLGSLHRRFRGCNKNIRAQPYKAGSQEYVDLELFLSHRGQGLSIEAPSVRR